MDARSGGTAGPYLLLSYGSFDAPSGLAEGDLFPAANGQAAFAGRRIPRGRMTRGGARPGRCRFSQPHERIRHGI